MSKRVISVSLLIVLGACCSSRALAQSLEISAPAPITSNQIDGHISPRDIGDSRLTDHFYNFVGNPGDLIVTIQTQNLNGDVDVFTSSGLRPLLKFTVYAESSAPITKSIFLRRREELILRVEARTPNDDDGIYQVTFGGSFEALPRSLIAESASERSESEMPTAPRRTGRRVSSVGARIYEPPPPPEEVAAATPEPTPQPTPEAATTEKRADTNAAENEPRSVPSRNTRRNTGRRTRPRQPTEADKSTTVDTPKSTETTRTEAPTSTASRRTNSRRPPREKSEPATEPVPDTGPRLVIETADGTLINKSMSTVRRVMVENGWVVVVSKDGGVQRLLLSQIVRMSIAPE